MSIKHVLNVFVNPPSAHSPSPSVRRRGSSVRGKSGKSGKRDRSGRSGKKGKSGRPVGTSPRYSACRLRA